MARFLGGEVFFRLVFGQIALEGYRIAREQAFDLGAVAFEQARQVGFDLVQLRSGHQFAAKNDLETVFPNAIPKMSLKDKLLLWVPGVFGGISLLSAKVIPALINMYEAYRTGETIDLLNSKTSLNQGLIALGILGAYCFRQYNNFINKKIRYSKTLSDSLYFKNLGNNSGAFYSLLNSSEEEAFAYESRRINYLKVPGKVVGKHQGAHYFTKGQRKGLAVGGTKEPLFVIETDVNENIIYTGEGKNHSGLYRNVLFVANDEIHWIREDLKLEIGKSLVVEARIRYRQKLEKATLYQVENGMYVEFENPQSAIQEGQFVAWYQNEELLGSGVIS